MTQQTPSQTAADAVLQMALQMEEIGRDFYEAFASSTSDPKVRQLCLKLAIAEQNHHKTFQMMRSELARQGRTILLSDEQYAEYRQKAKQAVIPHPAIVHRMAMEGDVSALFNMAIKMEQDSIEFYSSFLYSVPDRSTLETIIREEQEHLRILQVYASGKSENSPV